MIKIYLIRHSVTEGNLKRRYIGKTDEPLCRQGIELLDACEYPKAEIVFSSPLKRCIQTAEIIYPDKEIHIIQELAECDFGLFENRNYEELSDVPAYQEWVDSNGMLPFPGGESKEAFSMRCLKGFEQALKWCRSEGIRSASLVVHGGTIMSIMEHYAQPPLDYYDFQIGNGEGYELCIADSAGDCRFYHRSDAGRPAVAVSPGPAYRTSDYDMRKNYKKIAAKD